MKAKLICKKSVVTFFLLLIIVSTKCQTKKPDLNLQVTQSGSYTFIDGDNYIYFLVNVKLHNKSNSTCSFVSYSCLTNISIVADTKDILICVNRCAGNMPTSITLKPDMTFSLPVIVKAKIDSPALSKSLKLGLIYLQLQNFEKFQDEVMKRRESFKDIIWSEPFELNDAQGKPYEIY